MHKSRADRGFPDGRALSGARVPQPIDGFGKKKHRWWELIDESTRGQPHYAGMKPLPTTLSTGSKSLGTQRISCAKVALDVPLPKFFDYAVPSEMNLFAGDRVMVPFGARERLGVVIEADATSDVPGKLKTISAVRDDAPRLGAGWLELMRFLSTYYQRPLGETVIGALPPRLRSTRPLPRKALQHSGETQPSARFVEPHRPTSEQASPAAARPRCTSTSSRGRSRAASKPSCWCPRSA